MYGSREYFGERWSEDRGRRSRVALTGKTKVDRGGRSVNRSSRSDWTSRQYRCEDCGHVGWSTHYDLKRLEEARSGSTD
jgi:hypothetical protein